MFRITDDEVCPCGSTRNAGTCCLRTRDIRQQDGTLLKGRTIETAQSETGNPIAVTGICVPGCYAACLSDCGGEIEGEHYISHEMLQLLAGEGAVLTVTGVDPKRPEVGRTVAPKRLVAPILCARHNRALKGIDTAGNRFFLAMSTLEKTLQGSVGARNVVAFNGHDLERWCLKALSGLLARSGRTVPDLWIRILFNRGSFLPPRGLYVYSSLGERSDGKDIGLQELRGVNDVVTGVVVRLLNAEFVLSMHPTMAMMAEALHPGKRQTYRPQYFQLTNGANGSASIFWFSWQDARHHQGIELDWFAT
jgi:hypothetical protein